MSAPEERTTLERIGRDRSRAPNYGTAAEEKARKATEGEFNYGGRSHEPDGDTKEDAARADPGTITGEGQTPPQEELFSSPLPDHAFPGGDLYDDAGKTPAEPDHEGFGFRPGRLLRRIFRRA
jgi:hypothetical protein